MHNREVRLQQLHGLRVNRDELRRPPNADREPPLSPISRPPGNDDVIHRADRLPLKSDLDRRNVVP